MSEYRIKIEEQYNGDKWYIPQICELEITRGWIQRQRYVWYTLINNIGDIYIFSTDTNAAKHITEERAMRVITDHKNFVAKENGKQIKSVTFKYPE